MEEGVNDCKKIIVVNDRVMSTRFSKQVELLDLKNIDENDEQSPRVANNKLSLVYTTAPYQS
jgi:hypothetical protein